jgi:hypothetical protein
LPLTVTAGAGAGAAAAAGGMAAGGSLAQTNVEVKITQIANKAFMVLRLLLNESAKCNRTKKFGLASFAVAIPLTLEKLNKTIFVYCPFQWHGH